MFKKILKTLSSVRHAFSEGQELWFSCLVTKFDCFDKKVSIDEIVEPTKTKIIKHELVPDQITKDDQLLIRKGKLNKIVRKYNLIIELDIGTTVDAIVYEQRNQEIGIVFQQTHLLGYRKKDIVDDFYKMVIDAKFSLEIIDDVSFEKNENFFKYKNAYNEAIEKFPEEIIKRAYI